MSTSTSTSPYPIGTPGTPWGAGERSEWLARQQVRRSYADDVVAPLRARVPAEAAMFQYGTLDYASLGLASYPLFAVRSRDWNPGLPVVLVTGGVHGYETSGVHGALQWLEHDFARHTGRVNLLVLPCVSPWGYETVNRWNPHALDPNRQFRPESPAAEAALAMACVAGHDGRVAVHLDLHETTDTDNSEFGPARAARDGTAFDRHDIPDGFYLVGDSERPEPDFQRALIDAVRPVTPIARPDEHGRIIGMAVQQDGVIHLAQRSSGLCGGITNARFVTTTEVYPDSASTSAAQCSAAQGAAVTAALAHLRSAG